MCLNYLLSKKEKKTIIDKITRKGIKVYKVAEMVDGQYRSPYIPIRPPYKGKMYAFPVQIHPDSHGGMKNYGVYEGGFHFFKTKAAAQRLCSKGGANRYKVIEAKILKSWICEIGTEAGFNKAGVKDWAQQETVIVARIAIFD